MIELYRVYVLQNNGGRFYIGLSDDVERRVIRYNKGQSHWTKGKGPWGLVWQSELLSLSDARKHKNGLSDFEERKPRTSSAFWLQR
jgi:putative endonuclease